MFVQFPLPIFSLWNKNFSFLLVHINDPNTGSIALHFTQVYNAFLKFAPFPHLSSLILLFLNNPFLLSCNFFSLGPVCNRKHEFLVSLSQIKALALFGCVPSSGMAGSYVYPILGLNFSGPSMLIFIVAALASLFSHRV